MSYKYITENNLYVKQTYMYSEYRGEVFLAEYLDSRRRYIANCENRDNFIDIRLETKGRNLMQAKLTACLSVLKCSGGECNEKERFFVNKCVQSFEVRKRIYTEYDDKWKPLEGANFEDYESYLLFAECLLCMYGNTQCLKYFSCLLKLDDSLLSVNHHMDNYCREWLGCVIRREIDIFYQLMNMEGVGK